MTRRVTEGDARFAQFGWLWQRTRRLAELLREPHILQAAIDLAEGMDRYAAANQIDQRRLVIGDAIFVRGLSYVELPLRVDGQ